MDRSHPQEGSVISDNHDVIRQKFETCLIDGLKGQPLTTKDGVVTTPDGEMVMVAPEASFLSVVRAYIKDIAPEQPKGTKNPETGKSTGMLAAFEKKLPFQSGRPN